MKFKMNLLRTQTSNHNFLYKTNNFPFLHSPKQTLHTSHCNNDFTTTTSPRHYLHRRPRATHPREPTLRSRVPRHHNKHLPHNLPRLQPKRHPDAPFHLLHLRRLLLRRLLPLPPAPSARATHVRLFLWAIFSAGMLAFACSFWTVLTLHESLCFFWVVIGGSALLFSAWSGDSKFAAKKEQYSDMVQSFGPIMLMFFGLGRRYVTTQLILHAAIMNARKLVGPTTTLSVNTQILTATFRFSS
ncbi:hypothetical protein ACSQ67_008279 [Phaseolus vulgaris]